jgi:hypothetical protein
MFRTRLAVRTNLATPVLLVAVLLTTPLFAAEGSHRVCTVKPGCHTTTRISACCCCDSGDVSTQPSIAQARIDAPSDHQLAIAIVPAALETPPAWAIVVHVDRSPPSRRPPDLPILFADLRL